MKERIPVPTSLLGIANKTQSESTLVLLRKRVFTKSPVRENRTPGSARGLSGNWQSYRAQLVFEANDRNAQFLATGPRNGLIQRVCGLRSSRWVYHIFFEPKAHHFIASALPLAIRPAF